MSGNQPGNGFLVCVFKGILDPTEDSVMKFVVLILLAAIVISLGTGLFYLRREDADSPKMLRALEVRVGLSLVLILFLVASYFLGWIEPLTP
jgi:Flp pilus assembly protein protease CpaA